MVGSESRPDDTIEWEDVSLPGAEKEGDSYVPQVGDSLDWEEVSGTTQEEPSQDQDRGDASLMSKKESSLSDPDDTNASDLSIESAPAQTLEEAYWKSVKRGHEHFARINYPVLASIVNEYVSRAEITGEGLIRPKSMWVTVRPPERGEESLGSWEEGKNGDYRLSIIAPNIFRSVCIDTKLKKTDLLTKEIDRNFASEILATLCHEQVHARSTTAEDHQHMQTLKKLLSHVTPFPLKVGGSGYRDIAYMDGRRVVSHKLFNEGVTDLLGEEVFKKYLERSGDRAMYMNDKGDVSYGRSYEVAKKFIRTFCAKLAVAGGVPVDAVWGAVVEGYFNQQDMSLKTMKRIFEGVFDKVLLEEMAESSPNDGERIKRMITKIEEYDFSGEDIGEMRTIIEKDKEKK
jgi:hypothetical protein